jgi:hypothetical protein
MEEGFFRLNVQPKRHMVVAVLFAWSRQMYLCQGLFRLWELQPTRVRPGAALVEFGLKGWCQDPL